MKNILIILLLSVSICSGQIPSIGGKIAPTKGIEIVLPVVELVDIYEITTISAKINSLIVDDGGQFPTEKGILFSNSPMPVVEYNLKKIDNSDLYFFTSSLNGIASGITYYVRAYAINDAGVAYSNQMSFTTQNIATIASVSINPVSNVTTGSATFSGIVTDNNGAEVTERGFVWGNTFPPTINHNSIAAGKGDGFYTSNITGLQDDATYYVKAYAINSVGFTYSYNYASFKTDKLQPPTVKTIYPPLSITSTDALVSGEVTDEGDGNVSSYGISYSVLSTAYGTTQQGVGSKDYFSSTLPMLMPNMTYYYKAFATNDIGTSYGQIYEFTTAEVQKSLPQVTTMPPTNIGISGARLNGRIDDEGNDVVTSTAFKISKNSNMYNSTVYNLSASTNFHKNVTDLEPNTTYYYRAEAANSIGIGFGDVVSFVTNPITPVAPSVETTGILSIGQNYISVSGNVSADGGSTVTERGILLSQNSTPTLSDTKLQSGSGIGLFNATIQSLSPNTLYYVRAYAINSAGVSYGNILSTTTNPIPVVLGSVVTNDVYNINQNWFSIDFTVTDDGGDPNAYGGLVWNTTGSPTLDNSDNWQSTTPGEISISHDIMGLLPNTMYYVRPYVINGAGVSYQSSYAILKTKDGVIACNVVNEYSGGNSYPTTVSINLGPNTGTFSLIYSPLNVPDLFRVIYNGQNYVTKYRGITNYNTDLMLGFQFAKSLDGKYDPTTGGVYPNYSYYPENNGFPLVLSGYMNHVMTIPKPNASPQTCIVEVYAPLPDTGWYFEVTCPQ